MCLTSDLHSDLHEAVSNTIQFNTILPLHPGLLQPGEESSRPLVVSTYRAGELHLLGLALCSNAEDENEVETTSTSLVLNVTPLLDIRAAARPARSGLREYFLGVEVSNASFSAVRIEGIKSVSAYWTGKDLVDTSLLLPNQSLRAQSKIQAGGVDSSLTQSDLVGSLAKLVQGQTDLGQEPRPGPVALKTGVDGDTLQAYLVSRRHSRLTQLRLDFPTIGKATLSQIFPLLDPLDYDVVVEWSIDGSSARRGISTLHGVRVAPEFSVVEPVREAVDLAIAQGNKTTRTMYEETGRLRQVLMDSVLEGVLSAEDDPVEVRVQAGSGKTVEVDLSKDRVVPLIFTIRNRSPLLPVRWILELPQADG